MSERSAFANVRAVIFDKDGTLIDVDATWGPAMAKTLIALIPEDGLRQRAAAEIGVDLRRQQLLPESAIIAESNGQICARLSPLLDRDPATLLVEFEHHLAHHVPADLISLDGAHDVLTALRSAGVWVGLATNDGEASARQQLDQFGWLDLFDSVIGYDSGFGEKPAPGMVLESMARATAGPEDTIMVGDSDTDLEAAHRAGCRSVLVHSAGGAISPTVSLNRLTELLPLVGI